MCVWRGHAAGQHAHGPLGLVDVEGGTLRDANKLLDHDVFGADVGMEFMFLSETIT